MKSPVMLMILDGYGLNPNSKSNAIAMAKTPRMDQLLSVYPHATLRTSGVSVGLPEGTMGNSEVGHLNIGAGRVVYQNYLRINNAIDDGSFFSNPVILEAIAVAKQKGSNIHLMGLLSDAGVHSDTKHLYAMLESCRQQGFSNVYIHAFTDGRDTPPTSGIHYVRCLQDEIKKVGVGVISTVVGRYYAMDRDNRWDRVNKAFEALVLGVGTKTKDPNKTIQFFYDKKITDEFMEPIIVESEKNSRLSDDDVIIFFNFRSDRARELTKAIMFLKFDGFERKRLPKISYYACMCEYDEKFTFPIIFSPDFPRNGFSQYLSVKNYRQLKIAETEKYPHVTFFFNGGIENPFQGEDRILVPSPRDVPTYDFKPEMSAYEVTEKVLENLQKGIYDVIILNFANPDMVGHTGVLKAAIKAVEVVDECMGKIIDQILKLNGTALIIADHGNAEQLVDYVTGEPHTSHTLFDVPVVLVGDFFKHLKLRTKGALCDVAPTLLDVLEIDKPKEMTGKSLIERE